MKTARLQWRRAFFTGVRWDGTGKTYGSPSESSPSMTGLFDIGVRGADLQAGNIVLHILHDAWLMLIVNAPFRLVRTYVRAVPGSSGKAFLAVAEGLCLTLEP